MFYKKISTGQICCKENFTVTQSTYKRNGKSMLQHEIQEDGQLVVYEREIKGDEMHVVRSTDF